MEDGEGGETKPGKVEGHSIRGNRKKSKGV